MPDFLIQLREQAEAVGRQIVADKLSEKEIAKLIGGIFGGRVESLAKENGRLSETVRKLSETNSELKKCLSEARDGRAKDSETLAAIGSFLKSLKAVQELCGKGEK